MVRNFSKRNFITAALTENIFHIKNFNLIAYASRSAAPPVPLNTTNGIGNSFLVVDKTVKILPGSPPSSSCTPGILSMPRSINYIKRLAQKISFDM